MGYYPPDGIQRKSAVCGLNGVRLSLASCWTVTDPSRFNCFRVEQLRYLPTVRRWGPPTVFTAF